MNTPNTLLDEIRPFAPENIESKNLILLSFSILLFVLILYEKNLELSKKCCIFVVSNRKNRVMTKEEILNNVRNLTTTTARNSMGCSENWYNWFYALRETFGIEKLEKMSEEELNDLLKLAEVLADAFY